MRLGIETIYQTNSMIPTMSIARNLFIGREPLAASIFGFGFMDQARMRRESVKAIADVDLHLRSPDALVGELSGGQRQGVAIARAMHFKSRLLILDEPTNHLSVKETNKVIGFIKALKSQDITGIFISHNMHHVFQSCDRVVAMARGEIVYDRPTTRRRSRRCRSSCERCAFWRTLRPGRKLPRDSSLAEFWLCVFVALQGLHLCPTPSSTRSRQKAG